MAEIEAVEGVRRPAVVGRQSHAMPPDDVDDLPASPRCDRAEGPPGDVDRADLAKMDPPSRGIARPGADRNRRIRQAGDKAGDTRSEEHTSELQSLMRNSYAVFCLQKKKSEQNT